MSAPSVHDDWLSLIEISGPFLAVPVLKEAFPQGLEELDANKRKRLRQAYEEWREALELEDAQFVELHTAWIDEVLSRGLELDEDGKGDVLKRADWCAANLKASLPEHGATLSPDLAVIDEQRANKPLLLIQSYAQEADLNATLKQDGWAATPADRMVALCRSLGCRLGLVTNGERWMLVDAPVGAVSTFASWYARIWNQEPITLQAFVHLLGIRRFFVDESEQLPALFDRSLKFQDEVTDALGEQVRRAVEVLIQTLDKADQDRNRELLHDVKEPELYEAALTVMMRLVFLLSAEERGLLLMGDERYEANYALSTLRMQLRKESEEILERRWDAWSRLLATFRAVFGGIEHENLRLPALGGSLFDPDRFPFLEGRAKGSNWRSDAAKPLPIDNRTVLLLLEAIQQFQGRTLSYRALDVEQIGYVYEGLLERTVKRTDEVTLELDATKSAKTPWIKLAELDSARLDGAARLAELLQERSGSSASRVRNDLAKPVDDTLADRLLTACQGDTKLRDRVKPYAHLLRTDPWGYPLVYPAGALIVTTGSDRRETGTHYTPKSLTEAIVAETLTPAAYAGPAEGTPRDQWVLKSPAELLDLKICDPAMGSGAFLVQACRWLSDRLVEAWSLVETTGKTVSVDGEALEAGAAKELLPRDSEARTVIARRLIAERCLYGVDLNPLAVELAKLSIWLVTLAKGRPFGFLDHNLRCGDSLLGIHRLDQLTELSMTPGGKGQQRLFGQNIERAVQDAINLRQQLRAMPIRDIHDVEAMARLDADARRKLEVPERIADAFIGEIFKSGANDAAYEIAISSLAARAERAVEGRGDGLNELIVNARTTLAEDLPKGSSSRRPFHWPLEYPEVFHRTRVGFDCVLGNPPFMGGRQIPGALGPKYNQFLKLFFTPSDGPIDLIVFFVRRGFDLIKSEGYLGLIASKSIAESVNRDAGLAHLISAGGVIYAANKAIEWPGKAAVVISIVHIAKSSWMGKLRLNGALVENITSSLESEIDLSFAKRLDNNIYYSQGGLLFGGAFVRQQSELPGLIAQNPGLPQYIRTYVNGDVLNGTPDALGSSVVIDFGELNEAEIVGCNSIVADLKRLVSEERATQTRQIHETRPWLHWDKRTKFFNKARNSSKVIACSRVSKFLIFSVVDSSSFFSDGLIVFADERMSLFGLLQSSVHEAWVYGVSSKLGTINRYSTTTSFDTFPLIESTLSDANLIQEGARYLHARKNLLMERGIGLTPLYRDFHNPNVLTKDICSFRNLHIKLDEAVCRAFRWSDLSLDHSFREVSYLPGNDRIRFAISEIARLEILRRLLVLNRQRHEDEVTRGLHGNAGKKNRSEGSKRKLTSKAAPNVAVQSGFNFDSLAVNRFEKEHKSSLGNQWGEQASDQILAWLEAHQGWFSKQAILNGCSAVADDWDAAIAELSGNGFVEIHVDNNRWRAKP